MNIHTLSDLDDDTLILVFGFLDVPDILRMRRTCTRLASISRQRVVWTRALAVHIVHAGLPFPPVSIDTLTTPALEGLIIRALQLTDFWTHESPRPNVATLAQFSAGAGTGVSEVRFLPAHPDWVVTVTRGIWPLITCWDFAAGGRNVAEWFRKRALITGVAVNSDPTAEACLAVSLSFPDRQCVEILAISPPEEGGQPDFVSLASIETTFRAMSLQGDIVAVSDDINETHIINWRTNEHAVLWGSDEPSEHNFQHNRALQVLLTPHCTFVVRARSFEAFPPPTLSPHATHHRPTSHHAFGWLDGLALASQHSSASQPPISMLLRAESDDPWASDVHTLDHYVLSPSPFPPSPDELGEEYVFPPKHRTAFPAARGHLRCTDIRLGAHGTALWIQPRPAHSVGLTGAPATPADETLVAAVLPGAFGAAAEGTRRVLARLGGGANWTAVDYDEKRGLVVLGESTGRVVVLRLG